jgi:RNA polymerase sigma-70 factor (ECF subfamily)
VTAAPNPSSFSKPMASTESSDAVVPLVATGIDPAHGGWESASNLSIAEIGNLLVRHREHLKKVAQTRLDPQLRARVDASDIIQDVFLRANKNLASYQSTCLVSPVVWLRTLVKQAVIDIHRRHYRKKRTPAIESPAFDDESQFLCNVLADSFESIGSQVARAELLHKVRDLLLEIHPNDREIIELKHVDGLSFQESAELLGAATDTIKKRYYRALERFREIANSQFPND